MSEQQWGTVREDYSDDGNAWNYFSHDQARSRAYRWGEDGIAGIPDDKQQRKTRRHRRAARLRDWGRDEVPGGPVLEGLHPFLATAAPALAQAIKPVGPASSPGHSIFWLNPEDALRVSKDELAACMTREQVAGH